MMLPNLGVRIAASILSVPPECIAPCLPMMAPLPTSPSQIAHRSEIDSLLRSAWDERDGYDAPASETGLVDGRYLHRASGGPGDNGRCGASESEREGRDDVEASAADAAGRAEGEGGITLPSTYGEITALGARQLFDYMGMYGGWDGSRRDGGNGGGTSSSAVTFYDLGSGAGRLVAQSYLELPRLERAVGIEMVPSRHGAAVRGWGRAVESGEAGRVRGMGCGCDGATLRFRSGDLFDLDVSDATHVYASSLCFTDGMMADLADKLQREAPKLKCVASLKPFRPGSLFAIRRPAMEFVEMSWTKDRGEGCGVYFYYNEQSK